MAVQETSVQATPTLNSTFGLSESFRKICAVGLIATTAFLAGCAKSLEDRVTEASKLPSPPTATLMEHPEWFNGDTISIKGNLEFEMNHKFKYTDNVVLRGSTTIAIPYEAEKSFFVYNLTQEGTSDKIQVVSDKELKTGPQVIQGIVRASQGKVHLEAKEAFQRADYDSLSKKAEFEPPVK